MSTNDALTFLQRLIQTPSLPGQEGDIARLVVDEMKRLGYDDAWIDEAGNAVGLMRGEGSAPALMFNTHLDHVDPGDAAAWPRHGQPYSGAVYDGCVWGRGASDIKGPLAAQVHGIAAARATAPFAGDVYVSATVQEEVGGLGARYLAEQLAETVQLVVIGEPSSNQLKRGHRGRTELLVHIVGRSCHASAPDRGANPLYGMGAFLSALPSLAMTPSDLGPSSVAPTLIRSDQLSTNVVPGEAWLTLDYRAVPGETGEGVRARIAALLDEVLPGDLSGSVSLPCLDRVSFTGFTRPMQSDNPAYSLAADDALVRAAERLLSEAQGREVTAGLWRFATDGGHFARAGMRVIGIGPGDEAVVHTVNEHIRLDEWEEAIRLNGVLASRLPIELA